MRRMMKDRKWSEKVWQVILGMVIALLVVTYSMKHLQRYEMRYEMTAKAKKYLSDVCVQLLGKSGGCYYFTIDSSDIGALGEEELADLYHEMDLERMKVVSYTSAEKSYYLLSEEDDQTRILLVP